MTTVLCVIGTRPEAIKMAPVALELRRSAPAARALVCATAQHRELLDKALADFGLERDFDLDCMRPGQSLAELTSRLIERLDAVFERARPDWIMAQGDTTTVLAAALVAFYRRTRFAHVEAGLRTGDLAAPYPEEMNRALADRLATLCFAPPERARRALLAEGIAAERVRVTGNTVVDALELIAARPYAAAAGPLADLGQDAPLALVTMHRRENFGEPLERMCQAVAEIAARHPRIVFIVPAHPNPNAGEVARRSLSQVPNARLVAPLDYPSLVHVLRRAAVALTDSGGIQEEAPSFGVPVLVMRDKTERQEAVEAGLARLVGTRREAIVAAADEVLSRPRREPVAGLLPNPFGDGHAARRIVEAILAEK